MSCAGGKLGKKTWNATIEVQVEAETWEEARKVLWDHFDRFKHLDPAKTILMTSVHIAEDV